MYAKVLLLVIVPYSDSRLLNGLDHLIRDLCKKFCNQMPFGYQSLYHSNSELLVHYSRNALNNGPFDEQTVVDHLNTELVGYSVPHCNC